MFTCPNREGRQNWTTLSYQKQIDLEPSIARLVCLQVDEVGEEPYLNIDLNSFTG